MTGRAGRRGKDNVGFVVLAPGQFQTRERSPSFQSPPDPLESKFKATYTTLLNLLDAFGGFGPIRDIAQKSYAFQKTGHRIERLRQKNQEIKDRLTDSARPLRLSFDDIRGLSGWSAHASGSSIACPKRVPNCEWNGCGKMSCPAAS